MDSEPEDAIPTTARSGCALVIGVNLVLGLMVLGAFWLIGRSLDQTRSGILLQPDDRLAVISAVCPGETLEAVRLFRVDTTVEPPTQEILWEVEGNGPFPERIEVGADLDGLVTLVPLFESFSPDDQLVFRLRSSQLQEVDAFEFTINSIRTGDVATVPEFAGRSPSQFIDAAFEATPCD